MVNTRKLKLMGATLCLSITSCSYSPEEQSLEKQYGEEIAAAKQATLALQKQLGDRLKAALEDGGLEQGIKVCSQQASQIAAQVSTQHGKNVGRTALRIRNPSNSASKEQEKVLQQFQQAIEQQKNPHQLEHFAVLEDGKKLYMRPIVMQERCLACHGDISEELRGNLAQYYPEDKASGFKPGELRGAFVVSW